MDRRQILDNLVGPHPLKGGLQLVGSAHRDNGVAVLSDNLLARVAVQPLGGRVPARDDGVHRGAEDGLTAELDNGRQPVHLLALGDSLPAFGQVAHRSDHQHVRAGAHRGQGNVSGELAAICSLSCQVPGGSHGPAPGGGSEGLTVSGVGQADRLRHQHLQG